MPDVEQHGYRAYPLVDHIADKIVAMFATYGAIHAPSTRYKDLVDLIAIVTSASVNADLQTAALRSEAARRGMMLPPHFSVPDEQLWERGYAAEAARSLLPLAPTLAEALGLARPFAERLMDGTAAGYWDPRTGTWTGSTSNP